MARVSIPVQTAAAFGGKIEDIAYTNDDGAGELSFVHPGGTVIVLMNNGSGGSVAVTLAGTASRRTFDRATDETITTGAADQSVVAVPDVGFNQGGGVVHLDLSTTPTMGFAVIRAASSN